MNTLLRPSNDQQKMYDLTKLNKPQQHHPNKNSESQIKGGLDKV